MTFYVGNKIKYLYVFLLVNDFCRKLECLKLSKEFK
jgi:hypothetical protein